MKIWGLGLFLSFILFPVDLKALGVLSMSKQWPMGCMPPFALAVGSSELLSLPPALEVPSERLTHTVLDIFLEQSF